MGSSELGIWFAWVAMRKTPSSHQDPSGIFSEQKMKKKSGKRQGL